MTKASKSAWVERAARMGYAAKGVVYALIGGLALATVFGGDGQVGGGQAAVKTLGEQPFGQVLLWLVAIGLFGYATWRFIQAAVDPEDTQSDKGGTLKRIGYGLSGVIHAALGVAAIQSATGNASSGGRTYVRELLLVDVIGPILAVAVGAVVVGFALYQLYKAFTADFVSDLRTRDMSRETRKTIVVIARIGLAARGLVFAMVGVGAFRAAMTTNPAQAEGVGGALRELAAQPFGAVLLLLVATGLLAYGAYQLALTKYRRIPA